MKMTPKLGGWITLGGVCSFIAAEIAGVGPCTATTEGLVLMVAGLLAIGIGVLIVVVSYIFVAVRNYRTMRS
jgi:hypothetical protein